MTCDHKLQDRILHETNTAHNVTISRGRHAGSNNGRKLTNMEVKIACAGIKNSPNFMKFY